MPARCLGAAVLPPFPLLAAPSLFSAFHVSLVLVASCSFQRVLVPWEVMFEVLPCYTAPWALIFSCAAF